MYIVKKKKQKQKMEKNEAIFKIKDQLKKLMSFSEEVVKETFEVKYESMKLKDGSEIVIPDGSSLEPGVDVFTMDADGNQIPCEDNTYELENGQTIVVVGGKVESVSDMTTGEDTPENPANTTPEAMAAPAMGGSAAEAAKEGETPEEEGVENSVEERVASLESQIAQILELLQGMSNAQEMAMSKIIEISEAPAEKSIKVGKTLSSVGFNSVKK